MDLIQIVQKFLKKQLHCTTPLLLGYSGGPDSKALLYALLEAGVDLLHVAHLDHGWRNESGAEAERLADEVRGLGLPFHCMRLESLPTGNWEEAGRIARLGFFTSLCEKFGLSAVLLAHHQGDVAETVLKRLFEGAHLPHLGGMRTISLMGNTPVWRPFLNVPKKAIYRFLQTKNLEPLLDPTNEDTRFLRARLRSETFPLLERSFGKGIASSLTHLSERSFELQAYLDRKIAPLLAQRLEGPLGICIDVANVERMEARHAIQAIAKEQGIVIPRELLELWLDALQEGRAGFQLIIRGRILRADRGKAFF